jgi:hypothetical protein
MSTYMNVSAAERFAAMSDETLFGTTMVWEGEGEALKAERDKRKKRIDAERLKIEQERLRVEREQLECTKQRKDGLAYSDMLATEIVERIASGDLCTVICLDDHMPTVRRCNQWLREHSEFKLLFEQSLQDRLSIFEEQIIQIPDEAARDFDVVKVKGTEKRVLDPARITSAKLRVEVRRLHLIAGRPNKWGSSTTLITKSDDGFDPANLSADQLESEIAALEQKSRITRVA